MLILWVIKWSKSWMPHRRTFRNFTHRAWAIWDLSNHDVFRIIPDPGSQKRITLPLESISTVPFQARASNVNIPEWGQHCSNPGMRCLVSIFGTFRRTGNQLHKNPGALFSVPQIAFQILPIVRYSGQECLSPEKLVRWVLTDAQMTGTIVTPAGSWSCVSHHQLPVFISLYIRRLSESARRTGSKSRCAWNGRCANRNCIYWKISR